MCDVRYVECDNCKGEIKMGSEVYKPSGIAEIYCCAECYGEALGEVVTLTVYEADNCYKEIKTKHQ